MTEGLYLVYSCYGISEKDDKTDIIFKAARKAYLDFRRRISFQSQVPADQRSNSERQVEELLVNELPKLLAADTQDEFDKIHHQVCEDILQVYSVVGKQPYGIAQRWVNQTLLELLIVEKFLDVNYWNTHGKRRYFHVPVGRYLLEAASSKCEGRFQHGLHLKTAPMKHDDMKNFHNGWYVPGETQPPESWGYDEYLQFQMAVRKKITDVLSDRYKDCIEWGVCAFLEVAQMKNR